MIDILNCKKKALILSCEKDEKITGSSDNQFVKVHKDLLGDLLDALKSGKTTSMTYLNNVIKNGECPEYVMCKLKVMRNEGRITPQERLNNELVASNMAELFKLPHAYPIAAKNGDDPCLLTVDMKPENGKFYTLFQFTNNDDLNMYNSIEEHLSLAYKVFFKRAKELGVQDIFGYVDKRISNLAKQLFFKKYVMGDGDSGGHNIGVVEDESGFDISGLFDAEQSFSNRMSEDALRKDMEFLSKRYPQVLNDLLQSTSALLKGGFKKIKDAVNSVENINDKLAGQMVLFVVQNLTSIDVMAREIQEEKSNY